eukprot:1142905-Pelagomonas_calceolata.AAC.4
MAASMQHWSLLQLKCARTLLQKILLAYHNSGYTINMLKSKSLKYNKATFQTGSILLLAKPQSWARAPHLTYRPARAVKFVWLGVQRPNVWAHDYGTYAWMRGKAGLPVPSVPPGQPTKKNPSACFCVPLLDPEPRGGLVWAPCSSPVDNSNLPNSTNFRNSNLQCPNSFALRVWSSEVKLQKYAGTDEEQDFPCPASVNFCCRDCCQLTRE